MRNCFNKNNFNEWSLLFIWFKTRPTPTVLNLYGLTIVTFVQVIAMGFFNKVQGMLSTHRCITLYGQSCDIDYWTRGNYPIKLVCKFNTIVVCVDLPPLEFTSVRAFEESRRLNVWKCFKSENRIVVGKCFLADVSHQNVGESTLRTVTVGICTKQTTYQNQTGINTIRCHSHPVWRIFSSTVMIGTF